MSKLAIITGGTRGIGKAIIEKFAEQKFDIVTCSRSASELSDLKKQIETKYGVRTYILTVDVSNRHDVKAFTDFIAHLDRPVDVLVNNAGYFKPGEILSEPDDVMEDMMTGNVFSAYHMTRGIAPTMKLSGKGHIFNMCSVASIQAYPNGGSYSISKFALLGFSKVLREELKKHNVKVTAVLAGATRTSSWDGVNLPDDRFMSVEDIANAIFGAYSLSPRSVVEEILIRPQYGDI
jgi:short-subunit dehydrogenase